MHPANGNDVLGQYQPSGGPMTIHFRSSARSIEQANPDTRRDSVDLQQDFDVGAEAGPAQEQEQEQDLQWTAELEATGSTRGDTGGNNPLSKATRDDVACKTPAKGTSQIDSHIASKRIMQETANIPISSAHSLPAPTPPLCAATGSLQAGRRVSQGKPLDLMKPTPSRPSSTNSTSEELYSDEREPKAKSGKVSKPPVRKSESKSKIKTSVKQSAPSGSTTPQVSATPPTTVAISVYVESTVSERAKKSRRTVGEQQTGEARIYREDLLRACVGAMSTLLGEGFRLERRVVYEEMS